MRSQLRPTDERKYQNSELPTHEILLIAQTLVDGDKPVELILRLGKQVAVGELRPTHFKGCGNGVTRSIAAQGTGCTLIKQNSHCPGFDALQSKKNCFIEN